MPKPRKKMEKVREAIRLNIELKMSYRDIGFKLGMGKTTVYDYICDFRKCGYTFKELCVLSDSTMIDVLTKSKRRRNERYENLCESFPKIKQDLKKPGKTMFILWENYKDQNPEGFGYSRFCYYYQKWKKENKASMHIDHKAGDKTFVDYAGKKLRILNTTLRKEVDYEFFIAILPASQFTYAEASESQKKENFIKSNENAFHYFGGASKALVPDCLRSAVTKADNYEPLINESYEDFARHYGTVVIPARPGKYQDKALVESAVNILYRRVYSELYGKQFSNIDELNQEIRKLIDKHNDTFFQKQKTTRRKIFEDIEQKELRDLTTEKYEIKEIDQSRVQFNYHVYIKNEDKYYSVPFRYKGKLVKVIYNMRTVEIYYDNQRIAIHRKKITDGKYVTQKDHMPQNHKYISEWSDERFMEWSGKIGEDVKLFSEKMLGLKEHPQQAYKALMGVLGFAKKYEHKILNKACKRALDLNCISYTFIKNYLRNKQYELKENEESNYKLPDNLIARGKQYFIEGEDKNEQHTNN